MDSEKPDGSREPLLASGFGATATSSPLPTASGDLMPERLELPRVGAAMLVAAIVAAVVVFVRAPGGLDFRGGWLDSSIYDGSLLVTAAISAAAAVAWDLGGFRIQLVALGAAATCGALITGAGLAAMWHWFANRDDLESTAALMLLVALAVLMTLVAAAMFTVVWSAIDKVPSRPIRPNPVAIPAAVAMFVACPLAMRIPHTIGQAVGLLVTYGLPWALATYLAAGPRRTVAAGASAMLLVDTLGLAYQRDTMVDVDRGRMSVVSAVIVLAIVWVFQMRPRQQATDAA